MVHAPRYDGDVSHTKARIHQHGTDPATQEPRRFALFCATVTLLQHVLMHRDVSELSMSFHQCDRTLLNVNPPLALTQFAFKFGSADWSLMCSIDSGGS